MRRPLLRRRRSPAARTRRRWVLLPPIAALFVGCVPEPPPAPAGRGDALVGSEPVPTVRLYEHHASALVAWRQAGARDRILLHLDAHADLDWLPDETIARIAASLPNEIADFERHPYAMEGRSLGRFSTPNFVYVAARLGIVRELVWVVPDGTFREPDAAKRLLEDVLVGRMQMVSLEEAASARAQERRVQATLLGLPVTICELADLPEIREPVLLDIDLDYFTTPSALHRRVESVPWTSAAAVLAALRRQGIRTDLATLSLSTMGGGLPPESRWLGREIHDRLRSPGSGDDAREKARLEAAREESEGRFAEAVERYLRLIANDGEDATLWYVLSRSLAARGFEHDASEARERAVALDPLLVHADLFEADRHWQNGESDKALELYDRYLEHLPRERFGTYALYRRAASLARIGRAAEALEAFRAVLKAAPEHTESRFALGMLLRDRGDMGEAIEQLRLARGELPDVALYRVALGSVYLAEGRTEEGVREMEEAVARRPCFAQARAQLASALYQLGRYPEAGRHLEAALMLQPGNPRLRVIEMHLRARGVRVSRPASPR